MLSRLLRVVDTAVFSIAAVAIALAIDLGLLAASLLGYL